jgi:D-3-phosphoglycerate dehydrogenase
LSVINENKPGVLASITDVFAKGGLNILQQINQSRGDIAYNVLDIDPENKALSLKELQKNLTMTDGVLSSRVVFGSAGMGYARNIDGEYFV